MLSFIRSFIQYPLRTYSESSTVLGTRDTELHPSLDEHPEETHTQLGVSRPTNTRGQ